MCISGLLAVNNKTIWYLKKINTITLNKLLDLKHTPKETENNENLNTTHIWCVKTAAFLWQFIFNFHFEWANTQIALNYVYLNRRYIFRHAVNQNRAHISDSHKCCISLPKWQPTNSSKTRHFINIKQVLKKSTMQATNQITYSSIRRHKFKNSHTKRLFCFSINLQSMRKFLVNYYKLTGSFVHWNIFELFTEYLIPLTFTEELRKKTRKLNINL